ncbi:MAG: TPR end-of-group domain-containing protein [Verrucomicrobiota bacterium]
MSGYETARLEDLWREDGWAPIRLALGVRAFGVNAWTGRDAGDVVIPEHDEAPTGHEELYVVVAGHAAFTVAGDEVDGPTGTIVFVRDPSAKRSAVAREPGTTVLTAGAKAGEAFVPQPWETNRDVFALLDAGKPEEAKRLLVDALGRYEDRATLYYNLACAEALLGETDAALEHLRAAIGSDPALAAHLPEDSDFASIRDDPRFAELLG